MKTRFILLFAVAALFASTGCEDDLLDITEEFEFEREIEVSTTDTAMTVVEVIDMSEQSSIIEEYSDQIESIEITEVKYWLTFHDGDDDQEITDASLKVADDSGSNEETIAQIQDKNLSQLVDNPTELQLQDAGIDKMEELIENPPHIFQLIYNTACNKGPLEFKVKFQFKIKMVASPLD